MVGSETQDEPVPAVIDGEAFIARRYLFGHTIVYVRYQVPNMATLFQVRYAVKYKELTKSAFVSATLSLTS